MTYWYHLSMCSVARILRPGVERSASTAGALQSHCLHKLAYFKAPAYFAFRGDLPQTARQKLARGEIKRLAPQCLARGEVLDLRAAKMRSRHP